MKTMNQLSKKTIVKLALLATIVMAISCSEQTLTEEGIDSAEAKTSNTESQERQSSDLNSNEFPQAQAEIDETLTEIFTAIQEKDADQLISFHAYGPKFTEFKDGAHRTGSVENEVAERGLVAAISSFEYDLNDLKIDVFSNNVAKVTFHADFRPTINGEAFQQIAQATLIFVRQGNDWKIVHEHLSPLLE